jgi:hypothetical protein
MNKYIQKFTVLFLAVFIYSISNILAQAPMGFNYQGVALSNSGTPISSKKISLRISLIESQQLGAVTYQEAHGVNTDAYGQFSIIIGNGQAVSGKMADVQWNKFPYYLKVELDLDGGTSYVFVGTSQLLSVPYALYANNAGAASIGVDSIKNELATIKLSQKGDSIILSNNRGSVYVPKVDSLSKILSQISSIKAGTIKSIKDSITKLPNGIAIGFNALNNFDSTAFNSSNIAIGQSAGVALTKQTSGISNSDNILIGQNAASSINGTIANTGAYQNIIIGNGAGQSTNALASQNVVIGHEAAKNSNGTIGTKTSVFNSNVAIGTRALRSAIISQSNVSIGADNLSASTQVNRNTMIGSNIANKYNGDDNVVIGAEMLNDTNSNGSKNVIIGSIVAKNIRGSKNIIIGYKAAYDSTFLNTNNRLIIANDSTRTPLVLGEFDNKKVTINGDLTVTGKTILSGSAISDSTIKALNKRIDSLVAAISTKTYGKIDSSTLFSANPVFVNKFLDSTFLPSLNFDGSKTYVNIGSANLASTIANSNITFEFWVKNILKNSTSQTVFSTGYDLQGQGINVSLNAGRLTFSFNNSNHQIGIDYPNDSLWHHVAFTNKEKSNSTIYLDGVEKMRSNNIGLNVYSSQRLSIGATINGTSPSDFYKGSIRKMRINKGISYASNFTPSYTYTKADSTIAFWELNDLGTRIKASDSAYNGTLYNGTWNVIDSSKYLNLNDSLVAYYPFSDNVNDSSVHNNHGVINGNVTITSDRFGNQKSAYMFNGGKIVIPHKQYLDITQVGEFSFSIWVYKTDNQNPVHILGKRAVGAQQFNWQLAQHINPGGAVGGGMVFTGVAGSSATGIDYNGISDSSLKINTWDHIVGVYNNGKWFLYKNGILISQKTSSLFYKDNSNPSLEIGNSGGWGAFYGKIDDLRIYNRAITQLEINYLSTH